MANVLRSLLGNRFSRWLSDNPPFYPSSMFVSSLIGRKEPILIDTDDLMKVYLTCGHARSIIDRKAEMFKNMEICLYRVNEDGKEEEIESHEILSLLRNPNPLQTQAQFLAQYSIYKDIFANAFIYQNKPTSNSTPKALWNLPSGLMEIVPTGKIFMQTKYEDIIDKFMLDYGDKKQSFETSEVIFIAEGVSDDYIKGESKLKSLQLPISNIQGALKTRNVVIYEKGAIGMISNESKDTDGGMPLGKTERERIERAYRQGYGISDEQAKILVTNSAVKWTPMTFPLGDLKVFEEVEDDFNAICGAYGMSRDIFPSIKGATFENANQAVKQTYQNTIQPEADRLMEILSQRLGLTAQGLKLVAEYDWLPVLKEDEQKEAAIEKTEVERLSIMLKDGVISHETYAEMAGVPMTGSKTIHTNTQANGTQGQKE